MLVLSGNQRGERLHAGRDELGDVPLRDGELQVPALHLAEFEHLLQESCEPGRVHGQHLGKVGAPLASGEAFHGSVYDAQRGHQLVGDICVELELEMVQFLGLLLLHLAEPHLLPSLETVVGVSPGGVGENSQGTDVGKDCPEGKQRMAEHLYPEGPLLCLVPSEGLQAEQVISRRDVLVAGRVPSLCVYELLFVISLKDVGICVRSPVPLVQQGETDRERADRVVYPDLIGVVDVLIADLPALFRREGPQGGFPEVEVGQAEVLPAGE